MPTPKQPRFRYIWYGDGGWCLELDKRDKKNREGIEGWEFIIQPSEPVIDKFNLRERGQLNKTNLAKRWYPKAFVNMLDDSPTSGRIFIHTDFEGQDTNFSRRESDYTEVLITKDKLINVLRAQIASLTHQLRIATSLELENWKQRKEVIKTVKEMSANKSPYDGFGDPSQNMEQQ